MYSPNKAGKVEEFHLRDFKQGEQVVGSASAEGIDLITGQLVTEDCRVVQDLNVDRGAGRAEDDGELHWRIDRTLNVIGIAS